MKFKLFSLLFAGLVLSFGATGCGSKADEDTAPKTPPALTPDAKKPASKENPGSGQASQAL